MRCGAAFSLLSLLHVLPGCTEGAAGGADAGATADSARPDAPRPDTGSPDAVSPDAVSPDAPTTACPDQDLAGAVGDDVATGSTAGATDHGDRSCASAGPAPDLSFSWTAPSAGTFTIDTNASDFDPVLEIFDACGGTSLACDDDSGIDLQSLVNVAVTAGQTIVIVVDGYDGTGTYHLNIHPAVAEICDNATDDDRDGDVDCADADCATDPACIETLCTDGLDNDGDTDIDCADADCAADTACDESMHCHDGVDNDLDGNIDCLDFDCTSTDPTCVETNCTDRVDNDMDGDTDCADGDCTAEPTCIETNCSDGLDDELDGLIDCADGDCTASCGETGLCADTMDNDTDGAVDCADVECSCDAACFTARTPMCPDQDLASGLGNGVAAGTVVPYSCGDRADSCGALGDGHEVEFAWTAPAAGTYVFDTEDTLGRGTVYDTVLSVRMGCMGAEIDCDDDAGSGLLSRVVVTLTAGQSVVIVLDAYGIGDGGNYTLNIHAM